LEYDQVSLSFEEEALEAIAELAIQRQIGARGLRAIMEETMTGIMYDIPSDPTIQSVLVTEACVRERQKPQVTRDSANPRKPIRNAGVTL
jgi:ATP-dependent Clp protease ATP-binding subunit ClpX